MNDRDPNHLDPALQPLCRKWLATCHDQAVDAFLTCTYRSAPDQDAEYARGRTAPGKITTNARGGQSKHNATLPDGTPASRAFDFAVRRKDGTLNWNVQSSEWKAAVAIGKQLGLVWGGDFHSIKDYDHFQLAEETR